MTRLAHRIRPLAALVPAAVALAPACAPTPKHALAVALLVEGDAAAVGPVAPDAVPGLELRALALPAPASTPTPAPTGDVAALVTRARAAYAQGEHDACRAALTRVDLVAVLAAGERGVAARALTLEAACAYGARRVADAQAAAARLAALALTLPEAAVAIEVEAMIGKAIAEAGARPRHPLAVRGEAGARLAVDGRPAGCTLPCTIDLPAGDHVLAAEADGFAPAAQLVRVPDAGAAALTQAPASPELAGRQWRARLGRGLPPADLTGAALLARLTGAPRVVLLQGGARVSGALVVDGALAATGTRGRGEAPALVRELAYDARVLRRPPLWARPWFWIAATGATLLAAGATVAVTYEPEVRTRVGL
ncbi:MAG TPA: PEGA domain-containing protein [Kofleriaceae bacterium]|nr:PEGA domain-containing protein [Kofleriaceae bacterium]